MNRSVVLGGISLLIAIMAILGGNAFAQRSQSCDAEAQAWVEKNLVTLPQTLREFLAVPGPYRKAVYRRMPPESKSHIWRAHLTAFLDRHPELSWGQEHAIQDAIVFASPDTFRIGVVASSQAARALDRRAQALHRRFIDQFGVTLAGGLVGGFGANDSSATDDDGDILGTLCECADADAYCPGKYQCDQGGCDKTDGGCGTLYLYDCDGLCK